MVRAGTPTPAYGVGRALKRRAASSLSDWGF